MFGLGDEFIYFECAACGCLQLEDPPADLRRYYPPDYYSFAEPKPLSEPRGSGWRRWAERQRTEAQLFGGGLWRLLARFRPRRDLDFLSDAGLRNRDAHILDVGCGNGLLLRKLACLGFRRLLGIDPFLERDRLAAEDVRLLACSIEELPALVDEPFDLIMFHHALEHMPDQQSALRTAARLLRPGGTCLIRIPIASCAAWHAYGADWVELDAPRHFFLHTPRSLEQLANHCDLSVAHVVQECISMPYWGSELYRRGLTLFDPLTGSMRSPATVFSAAEMRHFESRAARAIRQGQGGPAAFTLRKTG